MIMLAAGLKLNGVRDKALIREIVEESLKRRSAMG